MVREQLEANFVHAHLYDINSEGFEIWPNGRFDRELTVDLSRKGAIRPTPGSEATAAGIFPTDRDAVLFNESFTEWTYWQELWTPSEPASEGRSLPPACSTLPAQPILRADP